MRLGPHARAGAAILAALAATTGCRARDTLPTDRTVALSDSVPADATLAADGAGRLWIGRAGRLTAVDTAGRVLATVTTPGTAVPRVLWTAGDTLVLRAGPRIARAPVAGGRAAGGWSASTLRAIARDPRGAWAFAANRRGGVVGVTGATLEPAWGWPETGGEAVAVAVSPLGDRVYVSVLGTDDEGPAIQVRDAASGRVLFSAPQEEPVRGLTASPDGTLLGLSGTAVVRLRHAGQRLERVWAVTPALGGDPDSAQLRLSPDGRAVAAFGRGRGARMAVLDAAAGVGTGEASDAPLDAAWGTGGRLYLLEPGRVRVARPGLSGGGRPPGRRGSG